MTQLRLARLYKHGMTGGNPQVQEKTAKGPNHGTLKAWQVDELNAQMLAN